MLKLIPLVLIQSIFLVSSQLLLKMAVAGFGKFKWTLSYFKGVFTNVHFALSGLSILLAMIIWMYILKKFEFSVAYPLTSISYIIALLASYFIFNEPVPLTRWIGVLVIMIGVYLIVK
jgi:drug/metabolite transporter (DMT)-like permease